MKYSLNDFDGYSFPNKDIIHYGLDHSLIDSPGLLMHIFLSRILTLKLAEKIPKDADFNLDECLTLATVYHATRQEADYGKAGISKKDGVNDFMKGGLSDMDYALNEAKFKGFGDNITNGIQDYILTPITRKAYFPDETLEKDGKLNLTTSIAMLISWLIAGPITTIHNRFNDLRERRSNEIGKPEYDYLKGKIVSNDLYIPKHLLNEAIKDKKFGIKNEIDFINLMKIGKVTAYDIGKWKLNGFEAFANKIMNEYCKLCNIDDLYTYIKQSVDVLEDTEKKKDIKLLFEQYLGRELKENEIIPYLPGIELIFKRLNKLKIKETKVLYKKKIIKLLTNIDRVISLLNK